VTLTEELAQFSARAEALEFDIATARRERDSLRAELMACRAERDRLRLLHDAERPRVESRIREVTADAARNAQWAQAAEQTVEDLVEELAAVRRTLSWRVTRPLRAVRRRTIRG